MDDTMSPQARMCLFAASFAPLWFILILWYVSDALAAGNARTGAYLPDVIVYSFVAGAAITACIMVSCGIISRVRESGNMEEVTPTQVRDVTHSHAPSVMVYVFFVAVGVGSSGNILVLFALAAFVCAVFSRTNMLLNNPSLLIVGFRVYRMRVTRPDRDILLVTKNRPYDGKQVCIKMFAPGVFMDRLQREGDAQA